MAKNAYGYYGKGLTLNSSEQVDSVVVCDRHSYVTGKRAHKPDRQEPHDRRNHRRGNAENRQ